jgi:hypothetical protein
VAIPLRDRMDNLGEKIGEIKAKYSDRQLTDAEQVLIENSFKKALRNEKLQMVVKDDKIIIRYQKGEPGKKTQPKDVQKFLPAYQRFQQDPTYGKLVDLMTQLDELGTFKVNKDGTLSPTGNMTQISNSIRKDMKRIRDASMTPDEVKAFEEFAYLKDVLEGKKTGVVDKKRGTLADVIGSSGDDIIKIVARQAGARKKREALQQIGERFGEDIDDWVQNNATAALATEKLLGTQQTAKALQLRTGIDMTTTAAGMFTPHGALVSGIRAAWDFIVRNPSGKSVLKKIKKRKVYQDFKKTIDLLNSTSPTDPKMIQRINKARAEIAGIELELDNMIRRAKTEAEHAEAMRIKQEWQQQAKLLLPEGTTPPDGVVSRSANVKPIVQVLDETQAGRMPQSRRQAQNPIAEQQLYENEMFMWLSDRYDVPEEQLRKEYLNTLKTERISVDEFVARIEADETAGLEAAQQKALLKEAPDSIYPPEIQTKLDHFVQKGAVNFARRYGGGFFKGKTKDAALEFIQLNDYKKFEKAFDDMVRGDYQEIDPEDLFEYVKEGLLKKYD